MSTFNMFTVLGKDDKELVHSAFLCFALNKALIKDMFDVDIDNPILHSEINLKDHYGKLLKQDGEQEDDKQRTRLDILIESKDKSQIIAIENKFKAFPSEHQLQVYDKKLDRLTSKRIARILLCFNAKYSTSNNKWKVKTYEHVLNILNQHKHTFKGDELVLVNHYIAFLQDYSTAYIRLHSQPTLLHSFLLGTAQDAAQDAAQELLIRQDLRNFWMDLLHSELEWVLARKRKDVFAFSRFQSTTHGINITPKLQAWRNPQHGEYVLQLQGRELKFYFHLNDSSWSEARKQLEGVQRLLKKQPSVFAEAEFKSLNVNFGRKSCFVYREDLVSLLPPETFTLDNIAKYILCFYDKINNALGWK